MTSKHKKRQKNDMQPQFSYVHWLRWVIENFLMNITINSLLREAPQSVHIQVDNENYKYEFGSQAEHPIAYEQLYPYKSEFELKKYQSFAQIIPSHCYNSVWFIIEIGREWYK